ncbi:TonB-dependent receptor [Mucilaginibacter mali]|uniref:TonB-dependent receptor n=1 Tax=Mucilaginibacter mali TaxID=2740462 RepID=A0A7D4QB18_9SPHI|nr:TonB-dependent receptor [Mucilaginibacter mali]QKJ30344.1 TonB-dependent receptor [Mucilaginibacter mali]
MNKKITHDLLKKLLFLLIMTLSVTVRVAAQNTQTVSGVVTDETNQPVPGVTVRQKGTPNAVSTNAAGRYSIKVPQGATLSYSFVGYFTQDMPASSGNINVKLKVQFNQLQEVVAIGYQTVRKSDVTGAISSVKASELNTSAPTLGQALVGKVAGVQISQTDGAPDKGVKIRVRGIGSFSASSDPLYVIDGFPAGNDLYINPEDIETIDILKDAASAAIYGSRASGGVVLITTKHGKEGKGKFEYDVQTGQNQLAHKVKLLDADQYAQLVIDGRNNTYKDIWVNTGHVWNDAMYSDVNTTRIANVGSANAASVQIPAYIYDFASQKAIPQSVNTDWQDELYRTAFFQKHNLTFSGGNKDIKYYVGGAYQNQQGIVQNSGQERYNFRTNVEGDVNNKLHIAANVSYTQNLNHETSEGRFDHGPILGALIYMPYFPAYNADGSLATNRAASESAAYGYQSIENPVALAQRTQIVRHGYRSYYNGSASYKILPELTFKANLGLQTYNEKYDYYLPTNLSSGANAPGSPQAIAAANATAANLGQQNRLGEFTVNYDKKFGRHSVNVLAGYTAEDATTDYVSVNAKGFQNDNIPEISNKGADPTNFTLNSAYKRETTLLSYLARVSYNFASKYYLIGSFRADGSSRFGPENKYGYFPSVSGGWNLSEEPFYHNWLGNQSTVKLRGSWGLVGNYNIGDYNYQQTIGSTGGAVLGGSVATSTAPTGIKDNKLSWESTSQYNFGADLGLLKGRLFVIFNYYLSYTYNLLYNQPISAVSGSTTILTNLHDSQIRNRGFDVQLDGKIIEGKDFKFGASGNFSLNRNLVTKFPGNNTIIVAGAERSYQTHITQQGQPVGMFYGFKVAGITTADNYNKVPQSNAQSNPLHPGELYFVDTNGDGKVTDADKSVIGSPYAKFTYGFALNASYKGFDFTTNFNGSYGNQVLDGQDYYLFNMEGSGNQYSVVADRYRNDAQTGNGQVYRASRGGDQSNSTRLSTFYLQDGSFLRCDGITLGYTVPKSLLGKAGISRLRIFASATNVFTITKYKGYNPEVDYNYSSGATNSTQNPNLAPGVDYGVYPLVRGYNLGVNLAF